MKIVRNGTVSAYFWASGKANFSALFRQSWKNTRRYLLPHPNNVVLVHSKPEKKLFETTLWQGGRVMDYLTNLKQSLYISVQDCVKILEKIEKEWLYISQQVKKFHALNSPGIYFKKQSSRCSVKMFLEISRNLQEYTCARVFFLDFADPRPGCDFGTGVFLWILWNF